MSPCATKCQNAVALATPCRDCAERVERRKSREEQASSGTARAVRCLCLLARRNRRARDLPLIFRRSPGRQTTTVNSRMTTHQKATCRPRIREFPARKRGCVSNVSHNCAPKTRGRQPRISRMSRIRILHPRHPRNTRLPSALHSSSAYS